MEYSKIWKKVKECAPITWNYVREGTKSLRGMEDKGVWETVDVGLRLVELGKGWWNHVIPSKEPSKTRPGSQFLGYEQLHSFLCKTFPAIDIEWKCNENENGDYKLEHNDWIIYSNGCDVTLVGDIAKFSKWLGERIIDKFGKNISINCENWIIGVDKIELKNSRILDSLKDRANKYLKIEEGWSLLLHGPPGTGKSTLARGLGNHLGTSLMLRQLDAIVDCEENRNIVMNLLEILNPDVVILEDMDHCDFDWISLLKFLEELQMRKKVVIGTANLLEKFDSAITRPGRFDQLMLIDKLDEQTVMEMVAGDLELFEIIKNYPVAYIKELMKRVKALGKADAMLEINDIIERGKIKIKKELKFEGDD